jgi:hypothetical protein
MDWDMLYELADKHAVRPQLAKLILATEGDIVPGSFRTRLEETRRQNLADQLSKVNEFLRIREMLDGAAIPAVPFKGFWLAHEFYGNLADREGSDIDVFVRLDDMERIMDLMPGAGYQLGAPYVRKFDRRRGEYNFGRYEEGRCITHLEFHWSISPRGFNLDISLDDLATEVQDGNLQGRSFKVFSPTASLLLVIMHHGGKDAFTALKHVYDIATILQAGGQVDWEMLLSLAGRFKVEDLVYTGVRLAGEITGVRLPGALATASETKRIKRLARNRMKALLQAGRWGTKRYITGNWLFRIRSRKGLKVKLGLTLFFVRKKVMPWIVPVSLHHFFLKKTEKPDYLK